MWQRKSNPGEDLRGFVDRAVGELKADFEKIPESEITGRAPEGLVLALVPAEVFERRQQASLAPTGSAATAQPPAPGSTLEGPKKTINVSRPLKVQLRDRVVNLRQGFNEVDANDSELLESQFLKVHLIADKTMPGLQPAPGQPVPFGAEPMPRSEQHSMSGVPTPPSLLGSSDQGAIGPGGIATNAPATTGPLPGAHSTMDPRVLSQSPEQRQTAEAERTRQDEQARMNDEQRRLDQQQQQREDAGRIGEAQDEALNPDASARQAAADEARTRQPDNAGQAGQAPRTPPNAPNPPPPAGTQEVESPSERAAREAREKQGSGGSTKGKGK
jgi:hypothetical protein